METKTELLPNTKMNEIVVSYKRPVLTSMPKISCSNDAVKIIRQMYDEVGYDYQEYFFAIYLNNASRVLGYREISKGHQTGTLVHVSQVLAIAIQVSAKAIILVHNHPSGTLKPSHSDKDLVRRVEEVSEILNLKIFDKIIVTSESSFSFADEGLMNHATKDEIPF